MNVFYPGDVRPVSHVAWNLFLAVIPVVLAFLSARLIRAGGRPSPGRIIIIVVLTVVWAVFLPNTCYLLTEWRHYILAIANGGLRAGALELAGDRHLTQFGHHPIEQLLASTAFYILYTCAGLVAFFLAVWPLDQIVRLRSSMGAMLFRTIIFASCGLGVYLGLIRRYNSWDLVNPAMLPSLAHSVASSLGHPFVLVLMIGFAVVLSVMYQAFDALIGLYSRRLSARH
ncbi:MAG: DUF1361 domain-containing protein [Capsulimonadaceae bacterium]